MREKLAEVIMRFIANNPVSILFLGAILFFLLSGEDPSFGEIASVLLVVGIILQVIWMLTRRH